MSFVALRSSFFGSGICTRSIVWGSDMPLSDIEVYENLAHAVGSWLHETTEEWRVGQGTEIMDAYDAYLHLPPPTESEVTYELLADVHPDWIKRTVRVRCVNCQNEIETTLGKLRQKFKRGIYWWTMVWQKKIHILCTKYDLILSIFHYTKTEYQERKFIR
jgi:hypothetical protein